MALLGEQIEEKLNATFQPTHLKVINESFRHNVPAGSESHFNIVIVSDKFLGQGSLSRHRSIYSVLAQELANGVHALALHTYTLNEWESLQNIVPVSPACRGGGTSIGF